MKIETKYNIDDLVSYNIVERKEYKETCHCCQGSGKIKGCDAKEYECPNCKGDGVLHKFKLIDIPMSGTIEDIEIHKYYHADCRPLDIRYKIYREVEDKPWYVSHDYKREEEIIELIKPAPKMTYNGEEVKIV